MGASLIYSNIRLYRLACNLLYKGRYRQRFSRITELVPRHTHSVCELCFGDTFIAEWCRSNGTQWTGVDVNRGFCERARQMGFNAIQGDLLSVNLPRADVFVMAGSLYHFHESLPLLLDSILNRTNHFILSEPVRNLSSETWPYRLVRETIGRSRNRPCSLPV